MGSIGAGYNGDTKCGLHKGNKWDTKRFQIMGFIGATIGLQGGYKVWDT